MTDRFTYDTLPPRDIRDPMCEWLRRHGIDPNEVIVPGWIERQPDLYRVAYLAVVLDGRDGRIVGSHEERYVQLEGPPLAWPDVARRGRWGTTQPGSLMNTCYGCGGSNTTYQPFSGGREYYCPDCEETFPYEDGQAPPRVQMLADGRFDELRAEMDAELARRREATPHED